MLKRSAQPDALHKTQAVSKLLLRFVSILLRNTHKRLHLSLGQCFPLLCKMASLHTMLNNVIKYQVYTGWLQVLGMLLPFSMEKKGGGEREHLRIDTALKHGKRLKALWDELSAAAVRFQPNTLARTITLEQN